MDKKIMGSYLLIGKKEMFVSNLKRITGRWVLFFVASMSVALAHAQDSTAKRQAVDMATGLRSSGKIYVVVAVLCIILLGLFIYLINLDKKVGKLEKQIKLNSNGENSEFSLP